MTKLSKKTYKNLIELESIFNTKEEFISFVCSPTNITNWNNIPPRNGGIPIIVSQFKNGWIDVLFKSNTWQLTNWGSNALSSTYVYYNMQHNNDPNSTITGKILVGLDRFIKGPWHIYNNSLRIWDQDKHFEIQLLDCDFSRFIDFSNPQSQKTFYQKSC